MMDVEKVGPWRQKELATRGQSDARSGDASAQGF